MERLGVGLGTLASGGGSGSTYYSRLLDPQAALQQIAARDMTVVDWSLTSSPKFAANMARLGGVCIPVVSPFGGEWTDRNTTLWNQGDDLIAAVADNCDNTIVVVQSVGAVDMERWVDHPNVTAVVWANLGGQELANALVDVLYGDVNPSGRLVYTIARNLSDYVQPDIVIDPQPYAQINYTEGVSVDYRHFEKNSIEPRFWFGHGLSYSNFSYTDLEVQKHPSLNENALNTPIKYVADAPGGDQALYELGAVVRLNVTNIGPYDGTEIVQLYLQMPEEAGNPTKVLRGFESVKIRDLETQPVSLYLTRKDLSYWDVAQQTWVTPRGSFEVLVGASVADIRVRATLEI